MNKVKILVRLPNWLGDMVMAAGFMQQLQVIYPEAEISVIAKKGIHELLPYFPAVHHQFIFDKARYKGVLGVFQFGRKIRKTEKFDLFFCLPDSLSGGIMGWASGAKTRVGYKAEARSFLFTHAYTKPAAVHRVETYLLLLEKFSGIKNTVLPIQLKHSFPKEDYIVININSEAASRRLTEAKAVELLTAVRQKVIQKIILMGAPKEREFVDRVLKNVANHAIENRAGQTNLPQLVELLASAKLLLSTDSGPAHLANAVGTFTIVLFGAGNEAHTAPFNKDLRIVLRLNQLSCEPCEKNVCVRYATPQCLERLDSSQIVSEVVTRLNTARV